MMTKINLPSLNLLLQIIIKTLILFTPKTLTLSSSSSSSSTEPLVLPLTIQAPPKGFIPNTNDKLSFRHNVTLTVSLTVGSPPQSVTMVLDTGSELSWLNCKRNPNPNPTKTLTSVYTPQSSASYSPVPCSAQTCSTRTRDLPIPVSCDPAKLCHVILSYADATSLEGTLSAETFRIGSSTRTGTLFGCMDKTTYSSNPEEDAKTTGLMGLNRGSLSFISQMGFSKFSYCISGRDETGVLLFGDASFSWLKPLNYTPLVRISTPLPYFDRVAYTVQLEGITVAGKLLPIPKSIFVPDHTGAGQTIVDSGTQFTFLLGPVYNALKSEFERRTQGLLGVSRVSEFVFQGAMDLCYRVSPGRGTVVGDFPAVGMVFGGGAQMEVPAERVMIRVTASESVYCMTFGNADMVGIEAYVIGHHHQQNVWMEFDLVNSRVGFAQFSCDLATHKLGL